MTTDLPGLDIITSELFDYAGMYPPAKLPLDEALKELSEFSTTLRRPQIQGASLVVDWNHLGELTADFLSDFKLSERFISLALLGSPVEDDFEQYLDEIRTAVQFNVRQVTNRGNLSIVSFEVKAPPLRALLKYLKGVLPQLDGLIRTANFRLFFESNEIARVSDLERLETLDLIAELNRVLGGEILGIKVRGGGEQPITNPEIGRVLRALSKIPVPLKVTAGLHHPLIESDRYGNHLGFLNILTALYLARENGSDRFPDEAMTKCLGTESTQPYNFERGLQWGSYTIPVDRLRILKSELFFRVGSCSLAEPDADLARLFGC